MVMIFLASLFGAPGLKKEQINLFAALLLEPRFLNIGATHFFILGFAFGGLGLFGAPRFLDPVLKQGTKNRWGL
jgi:hypothetical protein